MLKKNNRISHRGEFEEIRKGGKIIQTAYFGLAWLKKEDEEKKLGVIVSKKISKKAVERNQIRRRIYEAVKEVLVQIPDGTRGLFLVKKNIVGVKSLEIKKILEGIFQKENEKNSIKNN